MRNGSEVRFVGVGDPWTGHENTEDFKMGDYSPRRPADIVGGVLFDPGVNMRPRRIAAAVADDVIVDDADELIHWLVDGDDGNNEPGQARIDEVMAYVDLGTVAEAMRKLRYLRMRLDSTIRKAGHG